MAAPTKTIATLAVDEAAVTTTVAAAMVCSLSFAVLRNPINPCSIQLTTILIDSTAGKLMEKAGNLLNKPSLAQKGTAKRDEAGAFDDSSNTDSYSGNTGNTGSGGGGYGDDSYGGNTGSTRDNY